MHEQCEKGLAWCAEMDVGSHWEEYNIEMKIENHFPQCSNPNLKYAIIAFSRLDADAH